MMKTRLILILVGFSWVAAVAVGIPESASSQQADVPEPAFVNFIVNPPYVPAYKGRDPFKPLGTLDRTRFISISELEFHGVIRMDNVTLALFSWRGNPSVRYTLRFRKLYSGDDSRIDGVAGDITDTEVVLTQGNRKIVYSRSQRRP